MIHRRVFYSTSIETARRRYVSRRARVFRVFAETKHFPVADEPNRTERTHERSLREIYAG